MNEKGDLSNAYVEDYYDAQVGPLSSYTHDRWYSSPVRKFEYRQTERALRAALSGRVYCRTLEIGPGDGVWTKLIREYTEGPIHLVEQSKEMLSRAKSALSSIPDITFEHNDFLASRAPGSNDLVIAIRCFEYFEDKPAALRKMRDLLAPRGSIVIVTKNPKLLTSVPVQHQKLHSDQISRERMGFLAAETGLSIESVYPAVLRWKVRYAPMRFTFDILHRIAVATKGIMVVPFLTSRATESYVYVLSAQ